MQARTGSYSCWQVEAARQILASCLLLHSSSVGSAAPCSRLQLAHAAGVPVVLDAGGATAPLSPDLLRCLAVISPNETELQGLTGEVPGGCAREGTWK